MSRYWQDVFRTEVLPREVKKDKDDLLERKRHKIRHGSLPSSEVILKCDAKKRKRRCDDYDDDDDGDVDDYDRDESLLEERREGRGKKKFAESLTKVSKKNELIPRRLRVKEKEEPLSEFMKEMQNLAGDIAKVRKIEDRKVVYSRLDKKSLQKYARMMKESMKDGEVYGVLSSRERKTMHNNRQNIDTFTNEKTTSQERRSMLVNKPQIGDFFNTLAKSVDFEKIDSEGEKEDERDVW